MYYQPTEAGQPVRLVGWHAVTVEPGASGTVHITPDARMWRCWNPTTHTWSQLSGAGQLLIARGLGDIRATLTIP